jgi:uncharacterized protein (TIGR03435 family)
MKMQTVFGRWALSLLLGATVFAQNPPAAGIEAASVKPNQAPLGPGNFPSIRPVANGVNVTMTSVLEMTAFAYGVNIAHVMNAPPWMANERFDVVARATDASVDNARLLREVLADRFGLRAHTETRELPRHRLQRSHADRLGSGLAATKGSVDCDAAVNQPPPAGVCGVVPAPGGFVGTAATMPQILRLLTALAAQFGGVDDAVLADETGLTGRFDIDFRFSAQDALTARTGAPGTAPDPAGAVAAFQAALDDQLGLRIDSRRGPVAALVIDSVSRPKPD